MESLFFKILNMSLTASILIAVVFVLRLVLTKAPKWTRCLLWAIVAVRLVCPFSLESVLSLIPSAEPVPPSIVYEAHPEIQTGSLAVNQIVNAYVSETFAPSPEDSANPLQVVSFVASRAWVCGFCVMVLYAIISYALLRRKVRVSVDFGEIDGDRRSGGQKHVGHKIYIKLCDDIETPFILGVIRPRIYIPSGVSDGQLSDIIAHEQAHLKRRDHLWKPLGFLILAVHWFNPLVWLAYILLCRDIELACDEKVVRNMAKDAAVSYSETLLSCSIGRRNILVCPLAFGEVGVKARIRNVLNYKKPVFWIIIVAVIASAAVAVCFLTNPKNSEAKDAATDSAEAEDESDEDDFNLVIESGQGTDNSGTPGEVYDIVAGNALENAIREAIIDNFSDGLLTGKPNTYRAAGFISVHENTNMRGMSVVMPDGEKSDSLTLLGMAMYMEVEVDKTGIHEVSGNHALTEITFAVEDVDDGNPTFRLTDFQTDYAFDKVPEEISDRLKSDMSYLYANGMTCYSQIIRESGMGTFGKIGRNMDLLCRLAYDNPDQAKPLQNSTSEELLFRELIYYGEYTLAYRDKLGDQKVSVEFTGILNRACSIIEGIIVNGMYYQIQDRSGELLFLESYPALLSQEEKDYIASHTVNGEIEVPRLIMAGGQMYYESDEIAVDVSVTSPDGVITKRQYPLPHAESSSNFGTGYKYVKAGDEYYVEIDGEWRVFRLVRLVEEFADTEHHSYYASDNTAALVPDGAITFSGTIIKNDMYDFKEPTILIKPNENIGALSYDLVAFKLPEGMEEWGEASRVQQHVIVACYDAFQESYPPQGGLIDIHAP